MVGLVSLGPIRTNLRILPVPPHYNVSGATKPTLGTRAHSFPTPTALCPLAQGCRAAATLGNGMRDPFYANGVVSPSWGLITSEGHNPVGAAL